jgi:hypothetical protein
MRRVFVLSLILGLFTMIVVGQAVGSSDDTNPPTPNGINDINTQTSTQSDSTSTSTDTNSTDGSQTTTQSTATETEALTSGTRIETVVDVEISGPGNFGAETMTEEDAARGGITPLKLSNVGNSFYKIIDFSLRYLFFSSIIFIIILLFYFTLFNNADLTNYVNQSLNHAGFKTRIGAFGKNWIIESNKYTFTMKLTGLKKLRMKIDLPKIPDIDPREFGFRDLKYYARTLCDLDVLPMRLRVVNMYLSAME